MDNYKNKILTVDCLEIGYFSGRSSNSLLLPVTASAGEGEVIAVIGRNGAGKSTFLRTLAGLQPPLDGEIYFRGQRLAEYSRRELARNIGYVSTEPVVVANMTAYDLVALGRFPHTNWIGRISEEDNRMIMDSLALTSMAAEKNKYLSEMSDGERQKVMIARVLSQDAGLMILDEPSAFLDAGSRYEILNILHRLSEDRGKTIIYSTHDLQMALTQSDKIWLITEGKFVEGAPEDLMLGGSLSVLFESPEVQFNPVDGTFSVKRKNRGYVNIKGQGQSRHWTCKAIERAGYTVTGEMDYPLIKLPDSSDDMWHFISENRSVAFSSLYDLVNHLHRIAR